MKAIISTPLIRIRYTLTTIEGDTYVDYPLLGKAFLRLEKNYVVIENFRFPLQVFLNQIEPHITWHKITIPTHTSVKAN